MFPSIEKRKGPFKAVDRHLFTFLSLETRSYSETRNGSVDGVDREGGPEN